LIEEPSIVLHDTAKLLMRGRCVEADARDSQGRPVFPTEKSAVAWSVTGALLKAAREATGRCFLDALRGLALAVGAEVASPRDWPESETPVIARRLCEQVWEFEDGASNAAVFEMIERALEHVN